MSTEPNRLDRHFARAAKEGRKSLILFLTAGFPSLEMTEKLIETIEAAGADVLELGVPFSDPIADGPTIQASSQAALKAGATVEKILDLVGRVRRRSQMPIVLFGAYNPFLHYGLEKVAKRAVEVGADGFLVPDLPMEESAEFHEICRKAGLALVYLAAPTTPPERMRQIASRSTGFLYFISLKGVTGTTIRITDEMREKIRMLQEMAGALPVAVGFGIQTPEHAAEVAKVSNAVVVGSALIRVIEERREAPDLTERVEDYVRSLKKALG